eukprot:TRINITY_DN1561_c0_g5_i1.p1 TRINITY_DN1561_c0_g5~~TRINITY_DN1561_c0_g5_i1.p1  ORF type:complete len:288 (-),score=43.68 TRINITY_DN1561_c0_g5_i1:86-949(-)
MENQQRRDEDVNYGAMQFDSEVEREDIDNEFEPVIISVWELPYPLGMKVYIYANFGFDVLVCVTTVIMLVVFASKSDLKEKIWVAINNFFLLLNATLKLVCAVKTSENTRLALIKLRMRVILFIPQLLFIIWSFLSIYFYIRSSKDPLHIWILLLLIYSYALSFVIMIDFILVMFFAFILLRIYANPRVPLSDNVSHALFRLRYSEEFTTSDDICTVCLAKYSEGSTLIYLPCHGYHHYHEECILHWLRQNSVCPVCKQVITEQLVESRPITEELLRDKFGSTRQGV